MAKVLLLSAAPDDASSTDLAPLQRMRESAAQDKFHLHSLTDDSIAADLIIFVELHGAGSFFERVRKHPFVRRFRENCFIFCSIDFFLPLLPGIYASLEKRWATGRTGGGFYLGIEENDYISASPVRNDLPYLFSFMGSKKTAPVRERLFALEESRCFMQETAADFQRFLYEQPSAEERYAYRTRYANLLAQSKFALCPRGMGTGSVRLFHSMRAGRVPVIISDDWVEPSGPQWEQFSIRVLEKDVDLIPELLREREGDAPTMGAKARVAWEQWFSPEAAFHRVTEWCLEIARTRRVPERWARLPVFIQYLRPFYLRHFLRAEYRQLLQRRARHPNF